MDKHHEIHHEILVFAIWRPIIVGKSRTKARSREYLLNELVECLYTHSYFQMIVR